MVTWPNETYVNESGKAVVHCRANGIPRPTISWHTDGLVSNYRVTTNPGGLTQTLRIDDAQPEDTGRLKCIVTNIVGKVVGISKFVVLCKCSLYLPVQNSMSIPPPPTRSSAWMLM